MKYDEEFTIKLLRTNKYQDLFYVPACLKASIGSEAVLKLEFLHDMKTYSLFDKRISGEGSLHQVPQTSLTPH